MVADLAGDADRETVDELDGADDTNGRTAGADDSRLAGDSGTTGTSAGEVKKSAENGIAAMVGAGADAARTRNL